MTLESSVYETLDLFLGPIASSGVAAPGVLPAGLIVLETTGWRTGRTHRTPVVAAALGDRLLVSTVRGRRSHWVRNLLRNPQTRYLIGDEPHAVTACVIAPGASMPDDGDIAAPIAAWLGYVADVSGCAFAVLSPREA